MIVQVCRLLSIYLDCGRFSLGCQNRRELGEESGLTSSDLRLCPV